MDLDLLFEKMNSQAKYSTNLQMTQQHALLAAVLWIREPNLEEDAVLRKAALLSVRAKEFLEEGLSQVGERQ